MRQRRCLLGWVLVFEAGNKQSIVVVRVIEHEVAAEVFRGQAFESCAGVKWVDVFELEHVPEDGVAFAARGNYGGVDVLKEHVSFELDGKFGLY